MKNSRISIGIDGLDEILDGGLIPGRSYLIRGGPGCGKTTLAFHFLAAGKPGKSLLITLTEPEEQLRQDAQGVGIDLSKVNVLDLSPTSEYFAQVQSYDIFSPAEVEREPTTQKIMEAVQKYKPERVAIDSMTQFRYLATDPYQYHTQVVSFLRFLQSQGATVVFTSEGSQNAPDDDLQFLSDGVINIEFRDRIRTLSVSKYRGSTFLIGHHAIRITSTGMEVFPRLVPEAVRKEFVRETIPSGVPEMDELLQGGIERGTVTLITGPSGTGKTTLGLQFMKEAAGRGERSVLYSFEESKETLLTRCENINIPVKAMVKQGTLAVEKIEPLRFTAEEFAHMARKDVEENQTRIVMIDSISGYRLSLASQDLVSHIHALSKYLANMGVTVFLINEVEAITGDFRATEAGISYLADNIIFLRYLEIEGQLRKAVGVLKKRLSDFEKTLRQFEITRYGIKVGEPLVHLRGLLSGAPVFARDQDKESKP